MNGISPVMVNKSDDYLQRTQDVLYHHPGLPRLIGPKGNRSFKTQ